MVQAGPTPLKPHELQRAMGSSPEQLFVRAVSSWLQSARDLHRLGVDHAEAWSFVAKPWLTTLVGWDAASELGRLAGYGAYYELTNAWSAQWDALEEQSPP